MSEILDMIIIGSGPAGLAAGIYAARAELNAIVLERSSVSGGQVQSTYEVDNYPGIPGVSGGELSTAMRNHADRLGVKFVAGEAVSVERLDEQKSAEVLAGGVASGRIFRVATDEAEYYARTVIAASGASHSLLGCEGEEELTGMGVSYCATCDGAFFKGLPVAVVGGGDVAVEDAIYLSRICSKVYLIHRRDEFRAAKSLVSRAREITNIEFVLNSTVEHIVGEDCVESVSVVNKLNGEKTVLPVYGVFIAVGIRPESELFRGIADMNEAGYIIADETCVTSVPGFYAAGDIRTKGLRQIITAASDGANAVTSAVRYLAE